MTDRGYYNPCGRKMQANFLHGERIAEMARKPRRVPFSVAFVCYGLFSSRLAYLHYSKNRNRIKTEHCNKRAPATAIVGAFSVQMDVRHFCVLLLYHKQRQNQDLSLTRRSAAIFPPKPPSRMPSSTVTMRRCFSLRRVRSASSSPER